MIALGRVAFVPVLGVVALIKPLVLSTANDLADFAALVLLLQTITAVSLLALSLRRMPRVAAA
jgi:hypothetical protein